VGLFPAILEERASERRDRFDDERTVGELGTLIERRRDELGARQ
jgi:hypothetical protein